MRCFGLLQVKNFLNVFSRNIPNDLVLQRLISRNYIMHSITKDLPRLILYAIYNILKYLLSLILVWNETSMKKYQKFTRVIHDEIEHANAANRVHQSAGDPLFHSDLRVWLRDFQKDFSQPLHGVTTGNIPTWLNGTLVRIGPGRLTVGTYSYNHLFDSSAAVHSFQIKNSLVTYNCKLLKTRTLQRNLAAQRIVVSEFGTRRVPDPCKSIFRRFSSVFTLEEDSDNTLVSVYPFGDEVYTLTETPIIHRINPISLETSGSVNVTKYVNIVHHTSHPHVGEDGLVTNLGISVKVTGPTYTVIQFPNTQKTVNKKGKDMFLEGEVVAEVACRWPFHPGYMHTFGQTDNYYVIVEQPLSVSVPAKVVSDCNNKPVSSILKWHENYPTLIHVVPKARTGQSTTFLAEPFFYFHIINQYEEDNHIVIDICAYKDPTVFDCMYIESLKAAHKNPDYSKMFCSRPVRFVLPLNLSGPPDRNLIRLRNTKAEAYLTADKKVFAIPEVLCHLGCETPRINYPKYLGKKYRYFYAISVDVGTKTPGMILKVDVENKTKIAWSEIGALPGEPVFVPSSNQKEEDEGVILSTLLWAQDDTKVALLVLDARDMSELGRTTFTSACPIPQTFHGWFFP